MSKDDPLAYGVWLLRYGSKSRTSMRRALLKKGFEAEAVDEAVDRMEDWGYLNDARYAESLIRQRKINNVKGKDWLRRTLSQEQIEVPADFDSLYSDEEEDALILRLLEKWSGGKAISDRERQKYFGRLLRRGFQREAIFNGLAQCRLLTVDTDLEGDN